MIIFSTPEFKEEFEKLIKNKSYKYLSKELIDLYFDKKIEDCVSGSRLNGHSENPFIKKRIGSSGGSRLYLLAVVKKDCIYFSFIHPKTGSAGYENINNDKKAELLNTVYDCIKNDDLYQLSYCDKKEEIIFEEYVQVESEAAE